MRDRIEPTFGLPSSIAEQSTKESLLDPVQRQSQLLPHEIIARGLRALGYVGYVVWTLIVIAVALPALDSGRSVDPIMLALPLMGFFFLTLLLVAADGLSRNRWWGRPMALGYAAIVFFGFPFGTVISLNIAWHLLVKWERSAAHFRQNQVPNYSLKR